MRTLILAILTLSCTYSYAHDEQPNTVVITKAVELGVHRIERLVTLKKIDPMFINSLVGLRAERTNDSATPYKIFGFAQPDANNQSSTIIMLSDANGKVISHSLGPIFQPANPVQWPEADAGTLMEDALHFVLEGWVKNPEVKPFYLGLNSIAMTSALDPSGKLIALFAVTSDDDTKTLYIRLKTDGTFISHEIK